jgi:hypothetical protein
MRRTTVFISLFLSLSMATSPLAWAAPSGQIQNLDGEVRISPKQGSSKTAKAGEAVNPGTGVYTGENSHAILYFSDGQVVALGENSAFRLENYKFDNENPDKNIFVGSFIQGSARFVTGLIGDRNPLGWRVDTPVATMTLEGTDVLLGLQEGLYVSVKSGGVTLKNDAGFVEVPAGSTAYVADKATGVAIVPASAAPAGLLAGVEALSLGAVGGSATGGAGAAGGLLSGKAVLGVVLGLGVAAAIAAGGGGGDSTTNH